MYFQTAAAAEERRVLASDAMHGTAHGFFFSCLSVVMKSNFAVKWIKLLVEASNYVYRACSRNISPLHNVGNVVTSAHREFEP